MEFTPSNPHNAHETSWRPEDIFLVVAAITVIASLLIREFNDSDVWWHIVIGKDIIRTFIVPSIDRYTLAGWGRPYHDSHWFFQILVASAERIGGLNAVGLFPVVIWSATFFACYRTIRAYVTPCAASVLICVVAFACNYRFLPRPDIMTCLMISSYYLLLQNGRFRTNLQILFFVCLQIIWSNSHGLFVIGPFMAGCYLVEGMLKRFRDNSVQIVPIFRLMILLVLASLITPFGFEGWRYAFQLAQEAGPEAHLIYKGIEELAPVFSIKTIIKPDFWAFAIITLSLLLTTAAVAIRRRVPVARGIMTAALFCAALTGRRNIPLFCLAAVPLLAEMASLLGCTIILSRMKKVVAAVSLAVIAWFPLSGKFYQSFGYDPVRFGVGSPAYAMPSGLPQVLKQIGFTGQIYNNDRFGGFCLYHGYLPLLDGRWEVYDLHTLSLILMAPYDSSLWDTLVQRYEITGALLENGVPETKALISRFMQDGSFQLMYGDAVSSFWIRNVNHK